MDDERLINPDLLWAPGTDQLTKEQFTAICNRHANAIRPIPSRTALGYEHLMADADRGALIAEVERLWSERDTHQQQQEAFRRMNPPSPTTGTVGADELATEFGRTKHTTYKN